MKTPLNLCWRKQRKVAACYTLYLFAASILHLILTYDWTISGEMYAEVATNYYETAISGKKIFEQLITTDHGYVTPSLRIGPYIASVLNFSNRGYIYSFALIGYVAVVLMPSYLISRKFEALHSNITIRVICALAISSMFNFESRMYINVSYAFITTIFMILLNYYSGGMLSFLDKVIICMLAASKPFMFALSPVVTFIGLKKRGGLFFLFILTILLFNATITKINNLPITQNLNILRSLEDIAILCFYNFGKISLLYLPPTLIKLNILQNAGLIMQLTALAGLIFYCMLFKKLKDKDNRNLLLLMLVINVIWIAIITIGSASRSQSIDSYNIDFNRYDLLTALNIIALVALSKKYWVNKVIRITTWLLLLITCLVYSSASVYQYRFLIKENILYIGSSTWIFTNDNPRYLGCSLLSPLGWGYKCAVTTNIVDRSKPPKLITFNNQIFIKPPEEMIQGFLVLFSQGDNEVKNILVKDNQDLTLQGENIPLLFGRYGIIYKIDCSMKKIHNCAVKLELNNSVLYSADTLDKNPITLFFYKN